MNWKHAQRLISVRRFTLVLSLIVVGMLALTKSQPMAAGGQGNLPTAVDLNPDPNIFETNLVAQEAEVDLGNGLSEGPDVQWHRPRSGIHTQARRPGHRAFHQPLAGAVQHPLARHRARQRK